MAMNRSPSPALIAVGLLALILQPGCSGGIGGSAGPDSRGTHRPIVMAPFPNPPVAEAILTGVYVQAWPDRGYDRIVFELRDPQIPLVSIGYRQPPDECEGDPDLSGLLVLLVRFPASISWDPQGDRSIGPSMPGGVDGIVQEIKRLCLDGDTLVWGIILGEQKRYRVSEGSVSLWTRLEGQRFRRTVILEILH
jgi:hypothetical protein